MFHKLIWRLAFPLLLYLLGVVLVVIWLRGQPDIHPAVIFGILILAFLLAFLLSFFLAMWVSQPIVSLSSSLKSSPPTTPANHASLARYTEIEELILAIKELQERDNSQIKVLDNERSQLAAILFEMSDGVVLVDDQGGVRLANPAACELFGVESDWVIGRSLIEAFRSHQLVEIWQQSRKTGQSEIVTLEFLARKLYLQCVATPVGHGQKPNTLLLLTDLTRLRQLETIRQDFIHNVSHELRTPLASLKALAETLIDGALDDPPAARKFLQNMETEVDALSLMVSELLELSRIESGRVPLKMVRVMPCELLANVEERLRLQADRAGLKINILCDDETPEVLADSSRLEQVLVNLLHNSIKFTPEGGYIALRANQDAAKVIFSVEDTGIGIPANDMNRIFERFYKIDRARRTGGTGLGLAIARHLVEAHGGQIWAESIEGKGSTFYFSIPIAR